MSSKSQLFQAMVAIWSAEGESFEEWLTQQREARVSMPAVARLIAVRTGIPISRETVRRWYLDAAATAA